MKTYATKGSPGPTKYDGAKFMWHLGSTHWMLALATLGGDILSRFGLKPPGYWSHYKPDSSYEDVEGNGQNRVPWLMDPSSKDKWGSGGEWRFWGGRWRNVLEESPCHVLPPPILPLSKGEAQLMKEPNLRSKKDYDWTSRSQRKGLGYTAASEFQSWVLQERAGMGFVLSPVLKNFPEGRGDLSREERGGVHSDAQGLRRISGKHPQ